MARDEKHLSKARNLAILIFLLTATATFINYREYHRWSSLNKARTLISYWIYFDEVLKFYDRECLNKLEKPCEFHSRYFGYGEFGQVGIIFTENGLRINRIESVHKDPESIRSSLGPADVHAWELYLKPTKAIERLSTDPFSNDYLKNYYNKCIEYVKNVKKKKPEEITPDEKSVYQPDYDEKRCDDRWYIIDSDKKDVFDNLSYLLTIYGIELQKGKEPFDAYQKFERSIYDTQVKIPLIELETNSNLAVWVICLMITISSFLLIESLSSISSEFFYDEPWFVIDAKTIPGIALSKLWLLGLIVCPILTITSYFITLNIRASSGDIEGWEFGVISISALIIFSTLSLTNAVRARLKLIALRRKLIAEAENTEKAQNVPHLTILAYDVEERTKIGSEAFQAHIALARLGDTNALREIFAELESKDYVIQDAAIAKLAQIRNRAAYNRLYKLLDENEKRDKNISGDKLVMPKSHRIMNELAKIFDDAPRTPIGAASYDVTAWKFWFQKRFELLAT